MKIYKISFNLLATILLYFVCVLTLGGVGWNIYNLIAVAHNVYNYVSFSVLLIVSALVFVFAILVLFNSRYVLTKQKLTTKIGLIKTTVNIEDITQIIHFTSTKKLTVFLKDEYLFNVIIKETCYEKFVKDLTEYNANIKYSQSNGEK